MTWSSADRSRLRPSESMASPSAANRFYVGGNACVGRTLRSAKSCPKSCQGYANEIRKDSFLGCFHLGHPRPHTAVFHVRSDRPPGSSADHPPCFLLRLRHRCTRVADRLHGHRARSGALSNDDDSRDAGEVRLLGYAVRPLHATSPARDRPGIWCRRHAARHPVSDCLLSHRPLSTVLKSKSWSPARPVRGALPLLPLLEHFHWLNWCGVRPSRFG